MPWFIRDGSKLEYTLHANKQTKKSVRSIHHRKVEGLAKWVPDLINMGGLKRIVLIQR